MKNGYVIAANKSATTFFTSTSSYDRPNWIPLSEATVYPTAELAQSAMTKLFKNGSYTACLRSLNELMDMNPTKPDELAGSGEGDEQYISNPEDEMVAGSLEDGDDEISLDDDEVEFTDDDEDFDEFTDSDIVDTVADEIEPSLGDEIEEPAPEENEQAFLSPIEKEMMRGRNSKVRVGESGIPTDVTTIKYKQNINDPADVNFANDIDTFHNPFKTPANVISSLKTGIKEFNAAADYNNGKDDSQASMALTIASAMQDILTDLEQGTIEGLKQAQIRITSYMNPITSNFPPDVIDYLYKSGRQPISLKNIFYDKWDNRNKE